MRTVERHQPHGEWRYNAPRPGRDTLATNATERYQEIVERKFAEMLARAMRQEKRRGSPRNR